MARSIVRRVNTRDEEGLLFGTVFRDTVIPPIDPLDGAKVSLFKMIYRNGKQIMTNQARQLLDDKKFHEIMDVIRQGNRLDFETSDTIRKGLIQTLDILESTNETNGFQIAGSFFTGLGSVLMTIPAINTMWGTGAYAGGILLNWIGDEVHHSTREQLSDFRYGLMDNIEANAMAGGLPQLLKKYEEQDEKIERLNDWMREQERQVFMIEEKISKMHNSRHSLQFWHIDEFSMGIVTYLGINGAITLTTIADNVGNFHPPVEHKMEQHSSEMIIKASTHVSGARGKFTTTYGIPKGVRIISEFSLFALDSDIYERMYKLQSFFQGTKMRDEILRTAILIYLQNGC